MNSDILENLGLGKAVSPTIPNTYNFIPEKSFYADQVGNRPSAAWKKSEYIIVNEDVSHGSKDKLLNAWKNLQWHDQYLIFSENKERRLVDSNGSELVIGEEQILDFIRNRIHRKRHEHLVNALTNEGMKHLTIITPHPVYGTNDLSNADPLMIRLMAALRTKPFAILAGHSGTGKSRMVRRLAYMTCCDKYLREDEDGKELDHPGNFCMIQVKPNWHDNTELLGYYSEMKSAYNTTAFVRFVCKAYAYPHVPFFVCLDEMNLAPVEHYFAEYLSAIESAEEKDGNYTTDPLVPKDKSLYDYPTDLGADTQEAADWIDKHGLTIPKNLFVVGTVNMDETTCQFSRKVLDRAMTIEMAKVDFDSFGVKDKKPSFDDTLKCEEIGKLLSGKTNAETLTSEQKTALNALKAVLEKTPFMIAYRFANEYALYEDALKVFGKNDPKKAFDDMVLMKVLPRIAGERSDVENIFNGKEMPGLMKLVGGGSESGAKMSEILAHSDTYLSFWP